MSRLSADQRLDTCGHAGHEWVDAGGGVDICMTCEVMRDRPPCPTCGGRGWHTLGGNDPSACGRCPAGEAWAA